MSNGNQGYMLAVKCTGLDRVAGACAAGELWPTCVRSAHGCAKRGGPTGADLGADMTQLPEIRGLTVTPTDRLVLLKWTHRADQKHTLRDRSAYSAGR